MRKLLLTIALCLLFLPFVHGVELINPFWADIGGAVFYWDCTSTALNVYDATDGSTATNSGGAFTAAGVELVDSADNIYFTASDGNNIAYSQGTIEFKFDGTDTPQEFSRFFQHGTLFDDFSFYRNGSSTELMFRINDDPSVLGTDSADIWDGTERTIRVTWDDAANEKVLYINGVETDSDSGAFTVHTPTTDTNLNIGCSSAADRQAEGIISDFYIWHTVEVP